MNCFKVGALMVVAAAICVDESYAGPIEELISSRQKSEYLPIKSVPIHPWFGTGSINWDAAYSEFVDKIVLRRKSGTYELSSIGLSSLMQASIEKYLKQKSETIPPPADPELEKLRKQVEQLKEAVDSEKNAGNRASLKNQLTDLRKELLAKEAARPPSDSQVTSRLFDNAVDNIKNYELKDGLLRSDSTPKLSDIALVAGWKSVSLLDKDCLEAVPSPKPTLSLAGVSITADVALFEVTRTWLIGPLVSKSSFSPEGTAIAKKLTEIGKDDRLYRIAGLVVARQLKATGSIPGSFYKAITEPDLTKISVSAGCVTMTPSSGIGIDSLLSIPLPTASGMLSVVPQIIGVTLVALPSIEQ